MAPAKVPDLFAGAPVLLSARVRPEGGEIVLRGRTAHGSYESRVRIAPIASGGALSSLFGREAVEDAETRLAAGANKNEIDALVERLGLEHRIATRMTSWVAIDRTPSVDPRAPTRREVVPQQLPHGMSVEGLGLRGAPMPHKAMRMPMQQAVGGRLHGAVAPAGAINAGPGGGFGAPPPPPAAPASMRPQAKLEDDFELDEQAESPPAAEQRDRAVASRSRAEAPRVARPAPASAGAPKAKKAAERATLTGKIVLRKDREITIEIATWSAIDWSAEGIVFVTLSDGRSVRATVDASRTTTKSRLIIGRRARLVLVLDEDAGSDVDVTRVAFDAFDVEIG
jgi:Ca-activated chloride channel family protein